jgi:hypothetical protein
MEDQKCKIINVKVGHSLKTGTHFYILDPIVIGFAVLDFTFPAQLHPRFFVFQLTGQTTT